MTVGSLCSGIDGLALGAERAGFGPTLWQSEVDPAASSVLVARFPGVPNLGDLTSIEWRKWMASSDPRRKDELASDMYAAYLNGLSIEQVAELFERSRQTVWKMFTRRGWPLRQRPDPLPAVTFNGERYAIGNVGYYRKTRGDRSLLHRDIWTHHRGEIPDGWDIHHIDHDKTHNAIGNLECLPKDEHARDHGTGCNQFVHRCGRGVVPLDSPAVDLLVAGYP